VSRRPFASDMDRRVIHGTTIRRGVRATHNVCWRSDRSFLKLVMSFFEWNGGRSLSLLVHEVTHWFKVDFVMSPISSYHVDVVHSRSAEITAVSASVFTILHAYQNLY
jgi:hypothetical protein